MSPEQMLREFHSKAGLPLPDKPTARPELGSQTGRAKILAEEVRELGDAIDAGDITEIADACAAVVYAVVGTAVTYGIPFDDVLREVHRSNMTKLIPPVVVNGDGKIVKGPGYEPPDIAAILAGPPVDMGHLSLPADVQQCIEEDSSRARLAKSAREALDRWDSMGSAGAVRAGYVGQMLAETLRDLLAVIGGTTDEPGNATEPAEEAADAN